MANAWFRWGWVALLTATVTGCATTATPYDGVYIDPLSSLHKDLPIGEQIGAVDEQTEQFFAWFHDSMRYQLYDSCHHLFLTPPQWREIADSYRYDEFRRPLQRQARATQELLDKMPEALEELDLAEQVRKTGYLRLELLQSFKEMDDDQLPALFSLLSPAFPCHDYPSLRGCVAERDCYVDLYFKPGTTELIDITGGYL